MVRIFRHYIPASVFWLLLVEAVVLFVCVYLAVEIRFPDEPVNRKEFGPVGPKALLFASVMTLSMIATGMHQRNLSGEFATLMIRIGIAFGFGFLILSLAFYVFPDLILGRGVMGLSMMTAFFGILVSRTLYQKVLTLSHFRERILVYGAGLKAKQMEDLEDRCCDRGCDIIGYVSVDKDNTEISTDKIIDMNMSLSDYAGQNDISQIVIAMDERRQGFPLNSLLDAKMSGIDVRDIVSFLERLTGHIQLDALHPSLMILSSGFSRAVSPSGFKRLFDVSVSFLILLITSPVILLTAGLIWISSLGRHPIFYRQVRIGLGDLPFEVIKFRSMKVDAEKDGAQYASKKDNRITMIGRVIRLVRIDELPQLYNVLKGDMSFVGPRPERPEFVLRYEQNIKHYNLRHKVKPGITGWAQICYPYGDTEAHTKQKLQYDLYYIKNYSLFLDFTILLQTMQVVLFGQGAR